MRSWQFLSEGRATGDILRLLALLSFGVLWLLPGIGGTALLQQGDEAMHIAIIEESLEDGAWLAPQLYGVPNPFKPPLLYWAGMISSAIFGPGLAAARLPSVLAGALTAALIYIMLRRARVSALRSTLFSALYLISLAAVKFSRLALMEAMLTLLLTAGVAALLEYWRHGHSFWLLLAGLLSGVAALLKGPLALVYLDLALLAWTSLHLLRFQIKNGRLYWRGRSAWIETLRVWTLVNGAALFVFGLWMAALAAGNQHGADLLRFFLVVENAGKFSGAAQGEWRIALGLLLYTMPWTPWLAYLLWKSASGRVLHPRQRDGRILLLAAALMVLLHLIPERKGDYYVAPFLPLVWIGAALSTNEALVGRGAWALQATRALAFLLWLVSLVAALWAGLSVQSSIVFALSLFALVLARTLVRYHKSERAPVWSALLAGLAATLAFQFGTLSALERPLIGHNRLARQGAYCVASQNPHDIQKIAIALPEAEIIAYSPVTEQDCLSGGRLLLILREATQPPAGWRKRSEWPIYREQFNEPVWPRLIRDRSAVMDSAVLYQPASSVWQDSRAEPHRVAAGEANP